MNLPYVTDVSKVSGCSKRPSSKAAASEEARRYGPHFVEQFALPIDLGERKNPFNFPNIRGVLLSVEPLSDARTPLADFFSILLRVGGRSKGYVDRQISRFSQGANGCIVPTYT